MDIHPKRTLRQLLEDHPKAVYYQEVGAGCYWFADSLLTDILSSTQDISGLSVHLDKEVWFKRFAIYAIPPLGHPMSDPILYLMSWSEGEEAKLVPQESKA